MINTSNLHPVFRQALSPWINARCAYDLSVEAINRIADGEDGNRLVHVLCYQDGTIGGLSSSLHPDTNLSGYTESYRSLNHYAGIS